MTLGSVLWEVFDCVVLTKEHNALNSVDLQFVFKEHVSITIM